MFHANGNQKKSGAAILLPDKTDFKTETVLRDKERNYITIKESIHKKM